MLSTTWAAPRRTSLQLQVRLGHFPAIQTRTFETLRLQKCTNSSSRVLQSVNLEATTQRDSSCNHPFCKKCLQNNDGRNQKYHKKTKYLFQLRGFSRQDSRAKFVFSRGSIADSRPKSDTVFSPVFFPYQRNSRFFYFLRIFLFILRCFLYFLRCQFVGKHVLHIVALGKQKTRRFSPHGGWKGSFPPFRHAEVLRPPQVYADRKEISFRPRVTNFCGLEKLRGIFRFCYRRARHILAEILEAPQHAKSKRYRIRPQHHSPIPK